MKPAYLHVIRFEIPLEMAPLIQHLLYSLSLHLIMCIKLLIQKKKKKKKEIVVDTDNLGYRIS